LHNDKISKIEERIKELKGKSEGNNEQIQALE